MFARALIFAVVLGVTSSQTDTPLRTLAEARGKLIGTAVDTTALVTDRGYRETIARTFSSVTPENVMKWERVEHVRGVPDYTAADQLVSFAKANNQLVRGHTLVWHKQVPDWLTSAGFSGEDLADVLRSHVVDEASHFAGQLYAWDVVNEPFNDDGTWRTSIWYGAMGTEYVAQALQWARGADPAAKLYINDYNVEGINPKSDALYTLAQSLLARGVPLDGIGFQAHLTAQHGAPTTFTANLQRFADIGLDVAITEVDVRIALPADEDKLSKQADVYRALMQSCLAVDRCVSYTVWGFTDEHSWVPHAFNGQGAATLFDELLNPKPAYVAVANALAEGVIP